MAGSRNLCEVQTTDGQEVVALCEEQVSPECRMMKLDSDLPGDWGEIDASGNRWMCRECYEHSGAQYGPDTVEEGRW